jgi:hypothetical protein
MSKPNYNQEYYQANRAKRLQSIKEYRDNNIEAIRAKDRERNKERRKSEEYLDMKATARLASRYNVSKEIAKGLYIKSMQDCEICGIQWDPLIHKHKFCVDHCHTTGKIRGILCHHCNAALGHLKENNEIINNLLEYNRKHNG